ncbi:hypothetical protein GCM10023321_52750 [Pseudonocardia eucalypti]|uniref:Secreted protein n=1 Tax=Pseudonocardia eucalypti TaxID=648755 RepID=A0ABP9QMY0_9PSEU|nr:hypothetical protein [Pseudonocardia eucalypti]
MTTASKLTGYLAALLVLAGGAYAAGSLLGAPPTAPAAAPSHESAGHESAGHGSTGHGVDGSGEAPADQPKGLASAMDGYRFVPADRAFAPGAPGQFSFRIDGPDGAPVTRFEVEHDKLMHLIVVRRDGAAYQHLHPEMAPDGTWRVPLTVPAGGSYRAFADFAPTGGPALTLGTDLEAPGDYAPATTRPGRTAQVADYQVELAGELVPGQSSPLTLTVRRGGVPVRDLQPYLAAYGHLVALREGDLAYLHVHPDGSPGDGRTAAGPEIRFFAEVPSAGNYRLYLDFQHDGGVRTAEFSLSAVATHQHGGA